MHHHKIKVEKTAHFYIHGTLSKATQYLWIVAHGYGQLASSIIRKFEVFNETEHFVIAPEALNRFYWDFRKKIVGASWMTKQDRLDEIEDYSQFLTSIYQQFASQISPNCKIILLGFSQGCTTLIRWITQNGAYTEGGMPLFHHLVLWGGILPDDIDYQPFINDFNNRKLYFICGDNDEFINAEHIQLHLNYAESKNIHLEYIPFQGKHEILTDILEAFFNQNIKNDGE